MSGLDVRPPHSTPAWSTARRRGCRPGTTPGEPVTTVLDGLRNGSREVVLDPEQRRLVHR